MAKLMCEKQTASAGELNDVTPTDENMSNTLPMIFITRLHDTILRCRINAAFRRQVERRIYAAEGVPEEICPAPSQRLCTTSVSIPRRER